MHIGLCVKCLLIASDFNQNENVLMQQQKKVTHICLSGGSFVVPHRQTDGETNMRLAVTAANAPKH